MKGSKTISTVSFLYYSYFPTPKLLKSYIFIFKIQTFEGVFWETPICHYSAFIALKVNELRYKQCQVTLQFSTRQNLLIKNIKKR